MRSLRSLLPLLVLGVVLFLPQVALAANASFFGPLVPDECHCPGRAPDWGCVLVVIQNGMNLAVSLGVVFLTLAIAYAGISYMQSAFSNKPADISKAKEMIQNIVLGLLVMLSAWLLVDFVMKVLYNPGAGDFGPWNSILSAEHTPACLDIHESPAGPAATGTGTDGEPTTEPTTTEPTDGQPPNGTPSGNEVTVRARLRDAGISINTADACPSGMTYQAYLSQTGRHCTTVAGLNSVTQDHAISLAHTCGGYTLTGGSELGHSEGTESHSGGRKIDVSTGLSSCIRSHSTSRTPTFGSEQRVDSCNNVYTLEAGHWDINVRSVCVFR